MSHSSTTQSPGKTRRKTAYAVGAVLLMVGIAFAATIYYGDDGETVPANALGAGGETDPVASLTAMSAPLSNIDGAASGALTASGSAKADASGQVDAAITSAQAEVDAASAEVDAILAGTDGGIESYLAAFDAYDLAELRARLGDEAAAQFIWSAMPSTVRLEGDEIHLDETGHAEADEVLLQLEAVLAQVQAAWGSAEVQTLFATADQTAAENGAPVRVPGLIRSPFGADDAVEPDAAGAAEAVAHAEAMLSTIDGGYGGLHSGLQATRESQAGLAGDVDAALAAGTQFRSTARAAVAQDHAGRLSAIEATGTEYLARLEQSAQAYTDGLTAASTEAQASLDATLAEQSASIDNSTADAKATLEAHLASVRSEADARLAGIADAEAAVEAGASAGAISAADAEAFFEASAAAKAQVEAQVEGAAAEVAALQAELDAEAAAHKAALEAQVAAAKAALVGDVEDKLAWVESQVEMLSDIEGSLAYAAGIQTQIRAAAETAIDQAVQAYVGDVESSAFASIAQARSYAGSAQATVSKVQAEAYAEVGNDLGFIQAVIDDYASVPTPERQAAADALAGAQAQLDSSLGGVLSKGSQISAEAAAVLEASAAAEAALNSKF